MSNKGSCLTFNSLINLFPKVNDVLHCDFSIRQLHTLEFFFAFAFLKKPFSFSFHLTNYLPILALVPASVRWGLGGGARVGEIGEVEDFLPLFGFRETMWEYGKMEKEKDNIFKKRKCSAVIVVVGPKQKSCLLGH